MAMSSGTTYFRGAFKEWTKPRAENFDNISDQVRSSLMAKFYVSEVLAKIEPGLVPEDTEDLDAIYVDGSKDCGVDVILRKDNFVLIIQAKYRKEGKKEEPAEFNRLCDVITRLHPDLGSKLPKNRKLEDAVSEVDWEHDSFRLVFITTARSNEEIRAREKEGQLPIPSLNDISERVDVQFLDETDLNNAYRDAQSRQAGIPKDISLKFQPDSSGRPWVKYESEGRDSYIGVVRAGQLQHLLAENRLSIFNLNIRNWIGDTSTNKHIMATALDEHHEFFFYNNGVSAIARAIEAEDGKATLKCKEFSIINGAQTVRSLAKVIQRPPANDAKDACVLVRVTAFSQSSADRDFVDKVARFNNTQNAVHISDFLANDPIQIELHKRFSAINRSGKSYVYKNKRSGDKDSMKIPIKLEEFTKTVFSFVFRPFDTCGGSNFLFSTAKDGGYKALYPDEILTPEQFNYYAGIYFLCDYARQCLKKEKAELIEKQEKKSTDPVAKYALERRWMIYYTIRELISAREVDDEKAKKILTYYSQAAWMDKPEITMKVDKYVKVACEVLCNCYRMSKRANPEMVHRNWFRSDVTLRDIKDHILESSSIEDLPSLSREK